LLLSACAAAQAAALLLPGAGAVNRYVLRVRRSAANRRTPLLRLTDGQWLKW